MKEEFKPIVFTNAPIKDLDEDIIDLNVYIETLKKATESSRMIGIIGEYSSGKSSLLNLLENKYKSGFEIKRVSFIHYLDYEKNFVKKNYDGKYILKILTYNLAEDFRKNYISKKLSNNYGELSIAKKDNKYIIYLILSSLIYFAIKICQFIMSNTNISYLINSNKFNGFLYAFINLVSNFNDVYIYVVFGLFIFGLMSSQILFSLWDSQGKRKIGEEELISLFELVLSDINCVENVKKLIIIEDLDRIDDFEAIRNFLKLLYKAVRSKEKYKNIVFIVELKEEVGLVEKSDDEIFSKLFDYQLNLKKINRIDLKNYVLELLRKTNNELESDFYFNRKIDKFPEELSLIISGNKVSFREIKSRLNNTFLHYSYLKYSNPEGEITISGCAAISYLESEFRTQHIEFCRNQNNFDILERNYQIAKDNIFDNVSFDVKKSDYYMELKRLLNYELFGANPRMYFYRYPAGEFIPKYEDNDLIKMLNADNYKAEHFEDILNKVKSNLNGDKVIIDHLMLLIGEQKIPIQIIRNNNFILEKFLQLDSNSILLYRLIDDFKIDDNSYINESIWYTQLLNSNSPMLINFTMELIKSTLSVDSIILKQMSIQNFIQFRLSLKEQILANNSLKEYLFNIKFPIISYDELNFYFNNRLYNHLNLVCIELIDNNSTDYLIKHLYEINISDETTLISIMRKIIQLNIVLNQNHFLNILKNNNLNQIEYQQVINFKSNINDEIKKDFIDYIGILDFENGVIERNVLEHIELCKITEGFSRVILKRLYEEKCFDTYFRFLIVNGKLSILNLNDELVYKNLEQSLIRFNKNEIDTFIKFRLFIIKEANKYLEKYSKIFQSNFLPLTNQEIESFESLEHINKCIYFENIDLKKIEALISVINIVKITDTSVIELMKNIYSFVSKNPHLNTQHRIMLSKLNIRRLFLKKIDDDYKYLLIDSIYITNNISQFYDRLEVMKNVGSYDLRYFKLQNFANITLEIKESLIELISKVRTYKKIYSFVKNVYFDFKFNNIIENEMLELGDMKNYYSSRIIGGNYSYKEITIDILVSLLESTIIARDKLLENEDILSIIHIKKMYQILKKEDIKYFETYPLDINVLRFLKAKFNDSNELNSQISKFKSIRNEREFVTELIILKDDKLLNEESIRHIKELISPGQKQRLTKANIK